MSNIAEADKYQVVKAKTVPTPFPDGWFVVTCKGVPIAAFDRECDAENYLDLLID